MNIRNVIYQMMALSVIVTSCQREELSEGCGNDHSDEYVRIELTSSDKNTKAVWADADGSGNLSFHWENIGIDSKETESISLLISDGSALIPVWESSLVTSERTPQYHSPLSVKVREDDHRRADFQTVWFYSKNDLENAEFCCAYNGNADINDEDMAIRTLAMPSRFTQTRSQDPSFLIDYMHMYASGTYEGNGTKLDFKHIPSTLRLIITNTGSSAVSLQEVSVYVSGASASQDRAAVLTIFSFSACHIGSSRHHILNLISCGLKISLRNTGTKDVS